MTRGLTRGLTLRARITVMFVATTLGAGLLLIGLVYAYLRFTPVPFQAEFAGEGAVIDAAIPITNEILRTVLTISLVVLALMTAAAGAVGWFLAGLVIRPLRDIAATAQQITAGDTSVRITPPAANDEIAEVAGALNTMLDSLAAALAAQKRFASNASHELKTPIATIQTIADVALSNPAGATEALTRIREVNARNLRTVEGLLLLANAHSGHPLNPQPVDLSKLCKEIAAERGVLAEITEGVVVDGDPELLRQAVDNLVRNAVTHGAPNTATLALSPPATVSVTNADGDARSTTGHGLGLTLVQAIADAHRATFTITQHDDGSVVATLGF